MNTETEGKLINARDALYRRICEDREFWEVYDKELYEAESYIKELEEDIALWKEECEEATQGATEWRQSANEQYKLAESFKAEVGRLRALLSRCEEGFEIVRDSNHQRGHSVAEEMLKELGAEIDSWTNER
jgi:prefoldin subunit 5